MSAENRIGLISRERVVRAAEVTTAFVAASGAGLLIVREAKRRKTERKQVQIQRVAEESDTGEAGVIFVGGKSSFIRAV